MIYNHLIPARLRKEKFGVIIKEFLKLKHSRISVKISAYNIFIKVLRNVGMNNMAIKLVMNWSAPDTKQKSGKL